MKLRTVEMVGFKSFRDRVLLEISDGMTCIVGPNGCGKSNVVDAIKWAMGDMSPKSLRGDSLSDVIFAGTEKQRRAGMAEVTLTFDNSDSADLHQTSLDQLALEAQNKAGGDDDEDGVEGSDDEQQPTDDTQGQDTEADGDGDSGWDMGKSIPREFQNLAEIAITRRLHRSGESEYLINKVPCRLRDIQNLLAGTGLGKQGYSIIEQGQIGFIVNARPSERRLIIEEASGITRYKDQRKRADRKLERTEQNLQRTRDILEEIEKQLKTLEKQAEKAREHRKFKEELEGLEIALLLERRSDAVQKSKKLKTKVSRAEDKVKETKLKLEKVEENLQKSRHAQKQADDRHADLTENYYKVETRLNLAKSNREHALETREQAGERREELVEERTRQKERRTHIGEELVRVQEELERVDDNPEDVEDAIDGLEDKIESLKERRREVIGVRDELRRHIESQRSSVRRINDRLAWIDDQFDELASREEEVEEELTEAKQEQQELQRSVSRLTVDHERKVDEIGERKKEAKRAESALEEAKTAVDNAQSREEGLARRKLQLQARIESLEEMRRSGEGYEEGVRRILEWAQQNDRDDVYGPAGDFLHVPEGQESAYAAFLGDRLGDIVVGNREAALEALAVLSEEDAGRVACFPLSEDVDTPEALVSPWLDGLEIVEDLDDVPDGLESDADPQRRGWATEDGDVIFCDGRVVGGGTGEQVETLLRQARELERLQVELDEVVEEYAEASERLELLREDATVAEEELESGREALQETTHEARGIKQRLDSEIREQKRVATRVERLGEQRKKIDGSGEKLEKEHEELTERREEIVASMPEDEENLAVAESDVEELDKKIEEISSQLTEHKVEVAQVDERRRHLEANVERFERAIEDAEEQIERFGKEISEQKARGEEARMRAETLAGEVKELGETHATLNDEVKEAKEKLEELTERVKSLELATLGHRQDVSEAQEEAQEVKMARREAELEIEHATEQLEERYELDLSEARRRAMAVEVEADKRKGRAKYLKKRLRRIGEVNPLAIEEFEETKERHAFHAEQQSDLEESVADLRSAIERMDRESRKRFAETFEAVNEKFQAVFPELFQGGQASLKLTDPDNMLETGVDIAVQPPGKKLQSVTLLSGGEKALTAVSLIFAIFLLKPSPFAVLDEVDAPLDDANVGRFADMVSRLSELSQMIVITHNRRTMEAPERLYGVTMEEAGISKLVSVKLSEVDDRLAS